MTKIETRLTDHLRGKEAWRQPTFHNTKFLIAFSKKNSAMATYGLKEMGKFLWEGMEKGV